MPESISHGVFDSIIKFYFIISCEVGYLQSPELDEHANFKSALRAIGLALRRRYCYQRRHRLASHPLFHARTI